MVLLAPGHGNAAPKEWEFGTPGGNLIGINDIFKNQGVVIYDTTYRPYVTYISGTRFYKGFIAGESVKGFFLFDEALRSATYFKTLPELQQALREGKHTSLTLSELGPYFNLGSPLACFTVLGYMPILFLAAFALLKEYAPARRAGIAGFMVLEGAVVSAAALWLVLGLGGLFLSVKIAGYSFHINIFTNLALMVMCVATIWFMLYLNEEITQHKHPILVHTSRLISFIGFTIFIYWMASVLLTPSLPESYWQGQY